MSLKCHLLLFLIGLAAIPAFASKNRLVNETSPYLLQHKTNPIWWYPWGEEAFKAAKQQNKPIFLSVGYSTCHWCHVMDSDSFSKKDVADVINKHFIAIKVDREERPDVDAIYMTAVQMMSGNGGWPMTVFLTPDRKPFWAGTFLERPRLIQLANSIASRWQQDPKRIEQVGLDIGRQLEKRYAREQKGQVNTILDEGVLRSFYHETATKFDPKWGGFSKAPKFPPPMTLMALLRIHRRTDDQRPLEMATKTLDAMGRGGLYDQMGGGFHRYSTDDKWLLPHFEKMLYDNALLALAYLEAHQLTKNGEYARLARETLDYVIRDMTDLKGGYYSAEAADSEHAEGKFYLWQYKELEGTLTKEELSYALKHFGVKKSGNFTISKKIAAIEKAAGMKEVHHGNVIHYDLDKTLPKVTDPLFKSIKAKLMKIREGRVRPSLDDKVITSWNGLMIAGMARAYQVLRDEKYLESARKAARFIKTNLAKGGSRLQRSYRSGLTGTNAVLEDYAFLIFGLTELYQADFDHSWIQWALALQKQQNNLFYNSKSGIYFDTDGSDKSLLVRTQQIEDRALPSGNSVSALNLLRLYDITLIRPEQVPRKNFVAGLVQKHEGRLAAAPFLFQAVDYLLDNSKEIAVVGIDTTNHSKELMSALQIDKYNPNKVMAITPSNQKYPDELGLLSFKKAISGKATAYVCMASVCKLPTNKTHKAAELAHEIKTYSLDAPSKP